jgi:hypothetical protein
MTDPTPDPPAGLPLPALVARVRGEGERLAEAQAKATPGPWAPLFDRVKGTWFVRTPYGGLYGLLICRLLEGGGTSPEPDAEFIALARNSALPADALALCGRAERLEAACRLTLEVIARHQSVFRHQDPAFSRLAHDLRAALAGEPAEGDAGGGIREDG